MPAIYNNIAPKSTLLLMVAHAIRAPKLNAVPRNNCGRGKNLFIAGYNIAKANAPRAIFCANRFSSRNVNNPINKHMISNKIAWYSFKAPLARGRFFVRSTCASIFLSQISFIMHPALRIEIAPIVNKNRK